MEIFRQLYFQVFLGIVAAIILGIAAPEMGVAMKPLGDAFIALLRMMLGPIIFCSVVLGLTHVANIGQFGRLALKSLVYFEVVTTIAMACGFASVNIFRPGDGLHATNLEITDSIAQVAVGAEGFTAVRFFASIIPDTIIGAFARGEILQVLFVSVLVGVALSIGGNGRESVVVKVVVEGEAILFRMLNFIMRLAPIGAFGAMAAAIGTFGAETLVYLAQVVILFWLTALFFIVVVLGSIAAFWAISLRRILLLVREEILLILGTASGEVVIPRLMRKLEQAGCDQAVVGFVMPAGYSFNLDGSSIYMAIAVGFIAQATDAPLTLSQQLGVLAVMLLTSKGGSAVAGGAFIKLGATLQATRALPLSGLSLLFGIDRLMSTCTALTNMIGNCLAVFVVAKSERAFDESKFNLYLTEQAAGCAAAYRSGDRSTPP